MPSSIKPSQLSFVCSNTKKKGVLAQISDDHLHGGGNGVANIDHVCMVFSIGGWWGLPMVQPQSLMKVLTFINEVPTVKHSTNPNYFLVNGSHNPCAETGTGVPKKVVGYRHT